MNTPLPAAAALSLPLPSGIGNALAQLLGGLTYLQQTRILSIETALPGALVVERFAAREGVNELFVFDVDVLSVSAELDISLLLGHPANLHLMQAGGSSRSWNGYVTEACTLGSDGGFARYRVRLQPWLTFLQSHRDCRLFQTQTVQDILAAVFADYPEADFKWNVTQRLRTRPICVQYRETDLAFTQRLLADEGLSFRFEHAQSDAMLSDSAGPPQAAHSLVIFDRDAAIPDLSPASIRFHRADATETEDAILSFQETRNTVPNAVSVAAWDATQLVALAGQAQAAANGLPQMEIFSGHRTGLYPDLAYAQQIAELRLAGLQLPAHLVSGTSSARSLEAGKRFTLTEHYAADGDYIPLVIEHRGVNNLGGEISTLLTMHDLDSGSYRNRFTGIPASTPIVPGYRDKPTVTGSQLALVVGVADEVLTSSRDHQIKIQFPWQRGIQPVAGGLTDSGSSTNPQGHAPGDETAGMWVRVSEFTAGANHGSSFTPRIGAQVWVSFLHNDIDQPIVTSTLYTGQDLPPFAAGVDADANHPGTLSGIHTQSLDASQTSQWVHDDSPGQLRNRIVTTQAQSELNLGYLIDQQGAMRGGYRGNGFELNTQGWSVIRSGEGMLISTSARSGAQSTQHDASEAIGLLNAAAARSKALSDSATQQQALPLAANPQQQDFIKAIDPQQDGKYTGSVGGQAAVKPATASGNGDPVETFSTPVILLDTPSALIAATQGSLASFAGQATHLSSGHDLHLTAAATIAGVSGQATGLYTHDGGIQAVAANGPLTIQAHTDQLQLLADQSITITSTTDSISILANTKIVLQAGQSAITLDGQNITLAMPGEFSVKGGAHTFVGAMSQAAELPVLPLGVATIPNWIAIEYRDADHDPMANVGYKIKFDSGQVITGTLDQQGYARHENPPEDTAATVTYDERTPKPEAPWDPLQKATAAAQSKFAGTVPPSLSQST